MSRKVAIQTAKVGKLSQFNKPTCRSCAHIAAAIGTGNMANLTTANPGIDKTQLRISRRKALKCCRRSGKRHCSQNRIIKIPASSRPPPLLKSGNLDIASSVKDDGRAEVYRQANGPTSK